MSRTCRPKRLGRRGRFGEVCRRRLVLIVIAMIVGTSGPRQGFAQTPDSAAAGIEGIWQGKLSVMGVELTIVVHVEKGDEGDYSGTMDSPDQGALGIPIDSMDFEDGRLEFKIAAIAGSYEGAVSADGETIEGTWSQGGISFPLNLARSSEDEIPVFNRPQEPQPPFPYREQEVAYANEREDGIRLAATLTLPAGDGPFPAVVMITGSGPQDRDESLMGHKPFLLIADYLTRRGIAVLRADDRGVGDSTGDINAATSMDFAGDALAGVEFLKARDDIDRSRIGLIGHSEGGLIAPIAASQSGDVAFIVLMAGTGVNGEEVITLQSELIARAMGAPEEEIAQSIAANRRVFELIRNGGDETQLREDVQAVLSESLPALSEKEQEEIPGGMSVQNRQAEALLTPWFRFFLSYDPKEYLRQVDCPVLVLSGELDLQVPPSQNLPEIVKALEEGGNQDYTVIKFPGLNHLFQPCETGSPLEYARIEQTMSPEVLESIASWIEARAVSSKVVLPE